MRRGWDSDSKNLICDVSCRAATRTPPSGFDVSLRADVFLGELLKGFEVCLTECDGELY